MKDSELDLIFSALADSTRRQLLDKLSQGEAQVMELAEPFEMSLAAVSKHLSVLEKAGLIKRFKDGRMRRCQLQAESLASASEWIDHYREYWQSQLDSLAKYIENTNADSKD